MIENEQEGQVKPNFWANGKTTVGKPKEEVEKHLARQETQAKKDRKPFGKLKRSELLNRRIAAFVAANETYNSKSSIFNETKESGTQNTRTRFSEGQTNGRWVVVEGKIVRSLIRCKMT